MDMNFENQSPCMPSWLSVFEFGIFLSVQMYVYTSGLFESNLGVFKFLQFFFSCYSSIQPFCCVLSFFHILFQNYLVLVCFCALSNNLLVEFSSVILESPVLLALFDPIPVLFESFFFRQYHFIYFFQRGCQPWLQLSFRWVAIFFTFLTSFACRSYFICFSSLISYPAFLFLFEFFWGIFFH